jgi:ABC-2 type transport system ATP-binding protein
MSGAIIARAITKTYGGKPVLTGVSLTVQPGEIYGLFGANGSGKSTLLRILAGAIRPDSGSIAASAATSYVAQRFSLYDDLTVEENLAFFARCHGLAGGAQTAAVDRIVDELHLETLRRERSGTLSHGWKQRLALAAALCHRPGVLLLDEATAGLDPEARAELWTILTARAAAGAALVLATHQTEEAGRCSRLGRMAEGVLMEIEAS